MQSYGAICFDLDNTLCRTTQNPNTVLQTAFDRTGVDPFCEYGSLRTLIPELPPAQTGHEFYTNLFEAAAVRKGVDSAPAPELAAAYLDAVDPTAVCFCEGAEIALERARELGPVGLITNGGRRTQTTKLEALDIGDVFDVTVFTDPHDGVPPKPHSTPFERALAGLDADPSRTLHIGDSLHADVGGANAMGMDSAWIDTGKPVDGTHEPTYELQSLSGFSTIV